MKSALDKDPEAVRLIGASREDYAQPGYQNLNLMMTTGNELSFLLLYLLFCLYICLTLSCSKHPHVQIRVKYFGCQVHEQPNTQLTILVTWKYVLIEF